MFINLYNFNKFHKSPIMRKNLPIMFSNFPSNSSTTLFNPLPGLTLGIPLNIFQYIFTTSHYGENIVNRELILLQFCLGFFTYGFDRLFDAYEYYNNQEKNEKINKQENKITDEKKVLYEYLINNNYYFLTSLIISYLYVFNTLYKYDNGMIFILLLLSTLFYKELKTKFGQFKAFYIGSFWTISCIIMPSIIHDNNLNILMDYYSYIPCFLTLFGTSNLLDIKDIDEDLNNKIYTIPVIFGKKNSIFLSLLSIFLSSIIFLYNPNFNNNLIPNVLFEFQNVGSFFIPFSNNLTIN